MKRFFSFAAFLALIPLMAGCLGYTRGSTVPRDLRAVHLPAFENASEYPMAGAVVTRQVASALIEDGTFSLTDYDSATLRIQGVVSNPSTTAVTFDRSNRAVPDEYRLKLTVRLYAFDARTGEALIDGKTVSGSTTMLTMDDYQNAVINALPRAAQDLAAHVLEELQSLGTR